MTATVGRRRLLAAMPFVVVFGLNACEGRTAADASPSAAQIEELRARLRRIPQVTDVKLFFNPGHTFVDGPFWNGTLTAPGADRAALMHILDETYKTIWLDVDVPFGQLGFAVMDGAGGGVGTRDWPDGPATPADMLQRYGPRPSR